MREFFACLVFLLLAFPLSGQEEVVTESYLLARKEMVLPVQQKFRVTRLMSMSDAQIKMEVGGRGFEGTMSNAKEEELIYDFMTEDEIRISYEKSRAVEKSSMRGREDENEEIAPSEGKVILLEKKDGRWVGKLEVGKVEESDEEGFGEVLKKLEGEFNENEQNAMYGTEPRKIGESWDVDPSLMPGLEDFEVKGGELTVTFVRVVEFQGELCALLKTAFSIKAEMRDDNMEGMGVLIEGSGKILRSLNLLTDYKFTGDMTMKMSGEVEVQAGINAMMSMEGAMQVDMQMVKMGTEAEAE